MKYAGYGTAYCIFQLTWVMHKLLYKADTSWSSVLFPIKIPLYLITMVGFICLFGAILVPNIEEKVQYFFIFLFLYTFGPGLLYVIRKLDKFFAKPEGNFF